MKGILGEPRDIFSGEYSLKIRYLELDCSIVELSSY